MSSSLLIFLILVNRVWKKCEKWRRKCVFVSVLSQSHNWFRVSWKQCLHLFTQGWLKSRHNLLRSLIPYTLWKSKILFTLGSIKFSRFFMAMLRLSEFLIFKSNLFRWYFNNQSLKQSVILLLCLVLWTLFTLGIKSNK